MANGNSRAARSARAKKQLRDSKGRWIEMGRSRVTWYSSKAGKNLAGTAMKVTDDGDNAVVSVTDDQGVATDHVVAGKSLTIVNSKVTLPTTGKAPTNPKFYEKQAKNIAALELPQGADEQTQKAFDNAFETLKIQDKISPGIAKTITDSNGEAVNYGDLVETKKGPAFVIGNIPATNSSVLAFADGSVKTTKGHTFSVKDKGEIVPEQDSSTSEAPSEAPETPSTPEQAPAETEQAPGDSEAVEAWKIDESYLMKAPVGTTLKSEDGSLIAYRATDGWNNANDEPVADDDILDALLDHSVVQVSNEDATSSEDQAQPEQAPAEEEQPEEAPAPAETETEEAPAEETDEEIFANVSIVKDGFKVNATLPDGSTVTLNNYTGKKFAVVARPKIQGGSEWEVRLANNEESALQETGVTDQVFGDIKVFPIADKAEEPETEEETPEEEAPTQMAEPELEAWEKEILSGQPVEAIDDDADAVEEQKMVDDAIADPDGDSSATETEEEAPKGFTEGPLDKTTDEPWAISTYIDAKIGTQLVGPDGKVFTKGEWEWTDEKGNTFGNSGTKWEVTKNPGEEWTAYPEGNAPEVEAPATESEDKYAGLADWEKELLYGLDTSNKEEAPAPTHGFGDDHEPIDKNGLSVLAFAKKPVGTTVVNSDGDTYTKTGPGWEDQNGKFIPSIPLKNLVQKSSSDWAFGPRDLSGPKSSTEEEPESTPEATPEAEPATNPNADKGKITAQNFVKQTGSDEQGNYYTDANGKKVYEGEGVDYNKSKGVTYPATVAKVNKNNVILNVPDLGKNITAQQHKVFKKESTPVHESAPVEETQEVQDSTESSPGLSISKEDLDGAPVGSVIKDQDGENVYEKMPNEGWKYLPEGVEDTDSSDVVINDIENAIASDSDAAYTLEPASNGESTTPAESSVEYGTQLDSVPTEILDAAKVGDKVAAGTANGYIKQDDGTWLSEGTGNKVSPEILSSVTENVDYKYTMTEASQVGKENAPIELTDGELYPKGTLNKATLESMEPGDSLKMSFGGHSYTKNADGTWASSASGNDVALGMMESFVKGAGLKFVKAKQAEQSSSESSLTPGPLDPSATTKEDIDALPTGSIISNTSVEDGSQLFYKKNDDGTWDVSEGVNVAPHNNTTSKIIEDIMKTYLEDDFELLSPNNELPSSNTSSPAFSPAEDNEKLNAGDLGIEFMEAVPVGDGIKTVAEDGSFSFVYKKEAGNQWNSYDNVDSTEPIGDSLTDAEMAENVEDFMDAPYTYKKGSANQQATPAETTEEAPADSTDAPSTSGPATNGQAMDKADISPDFMKSMPVGSAFKYSYEGFGGGNELFIKKHDDDAWEISATLAKKSDPAIETTQSMYDDFIVDEAAGDGKGKFEYVADFNKGDASFSDPEPSELDYATLNQAPKNTKITVDGKGFTKNGTGNWTADTDIDVNDSESMGNLIEETPNATKTISYPKKKSPEEYQNNSGNQSNQGSLPQNGEVIPGEVSEELITNMPVGSSVQMDNAGNKLWFVKGSDGQWKMTADASNPEGGSPMPESSIKAVLDAGNTNNDVSLKYVPDPQNDPDPSEPAKEDSTVFANGQKVTEPLSVEQMDAVPVGSGFQNKTSISTMWFVKKDNGKWTVSTNSNLTNGFDMDTVPLQESLNGMIGSSANTLKYLADAYNDPNPDLLDESTSTPATSSAPHPSGPVDPEMQYDEVMDIIKNSPIGAKFTPGDLNNHYEYTKKANDEWISDTGSYKDDEDVAYYLVNEGLLEQPYTYSINGQTVAGPSEVEDTGVEFVNGIYSDKTPNLAAKIENAPFGAKLTPSNMSSNYQMTKQDDGWITDTNDYFEDYEVVEHIKSSGDDFTATGGSGGTASTGSESSESSDALASDTFINGVIDHKASDVIDKLKNAPVGGVLTPGNMDSNYEFTKLGENSWKTDTNGHFNDQEIADYFQYKYDTYTAKNFAPPVPVTPDVPTLDTKGWKKLSGAQGSNDGGIYENPDGEQYYLKMPASEAHAKNEVLADKFYQMAGIETSKLELSDYGGSQLGTASKMLEGSQKNLESKLSDPEYKQKLQEGFAMDAWLANWDVAGTGYDNVVTDANGNPVRVDPGGALLYRAMGEPKGDKFTDEVGELDSLRNGSNSYSKAIFGDMTDEQIAASISKVAAITPAQIDALVDSMEFDADTAKLYKDKLKKRRQNLIDRRKEFVPEPTFAGADAKTYNQEGKGLAKYSDTPAKPVSAYTFGETNNPQDDPLYGAPQPVAPTPVPYQSFNIAQPKIEWEGRDEWLASVEERFDANPAKNASSLQNSANWNKIQSILDGDTEHIDYLVTKKYLTPEMAETARTAIQTAKDNLDTDEATKQMQKEKDEYQAKLDQYEADSTKYQQDIAQWNAVNGTNATTPAPKNVVMPAMSTDELWEETEDWSKANHGTFTAEDVFNAVQTNTDTANHGLSMAIDSDQIENHDVRVTRIVGTDGKEHMRFEFKLTSEKGDQFAENLEGYEKQNGLSYPKLHLSTSTGLLTDTGTTTYNESNGRMYKKTLEGDRNVVFRVGDSQEEYYDYNAGGVILRKQSTFHNQITLTMPADSTPEDFAKTLKELDIKATPTTQGDVRVLAENKLMKAFGQYNPGDEDKTAIDPKKNFQFEDRQKQLDYIKEKYGITIDDVSVTTDESGHNRVQLSDEAAQKLVDRHSIGFFQHTFTYNNPTVEALTRIMTGSVPALRPAADRGMNGISATGQSAEADHQSGSGDYVFTTPKSAGSYNSEGVQIDPVKVLKNLDLWANRGDDWGARKLDVAKTPHEILDQNNGNVHEVLVQSSIPVAWWTHVTVGNSTAKTKLIENLTKAGITAVNGKTLSDFIKVN